MKIKIILIILILINISILGTVQGYNYIITPHYGQTNFKGVTINYIPMESTDMSNYGWTTWDKNGTTVTICVTGNDTEDQATFYHEMYHVMHPEQGDNDCAAENYASKMVPEYVPKNNT